VNIIISKTFLNIILCKETYEKWEEKVKGNEVHNSRGADFYALFCFYLFLNKIVRENLE